MSSVKDVPPRDSRHHEARAPSGEGVQNPNPLGTVNKVPVLRIAHSEGARQAQVEVIRESPVTFFVNDREVVTLLTILYDLPTLAVGFLFSEGWIRERADIEEVREDRELGVVRIRLASIPEFTERFLEKRMIGSSCGKATSFYNVLDAIQCRPVTSSFQVKPSDLRKWMKEMLRQATLYRRTRGTHNVGLYQNGGLIFLEQDIGRHNAVDRILGRCLLEEVPTGRTAMLTTGRLSSEMVVKAARGGVPILASRSATTSLAISLAQRLGITLLASVRGGAMTLATHPERISLAEGPSKADHRS